MKTIAKALFMLLGLLASDRALAGDDHTDFEVGQDGTAAHTLLIAGDEDILSGLESIELALLDDPFSALDGWYVAGEPGWEGLEIDEPDEGLFALLSGNAVALLRDSFDPGLAMFDAGENPILVADGASYAFAIDMEGGFHEDLFFAAPPGAGLGAMYSATFHLTDLNGFHADSAPFALNFVTVPEAGVGTFLLITGGGLILRRRHGI